MLALYTHADCLRLGREDDPSSRTRNSLFSRISRGRSKQIHLDLEPGNWTKMGLVATLPVIRTYPPVRQGSAQKNNGLTVTA
jgi:hypothetical protein